MNDTDFETSGQITAPRAEKAAEWIVHNSMHIGDAKASRDRCDNMLRVVKSLAMKASGETSAAAQEREAYASEQYRKALDDAFEATKLHETLLAKRNAATTLIDVWRSLNSNLKGART